MTSFFAFFFAWLSAWAPGPCSLDGLIGAPSAQCSTAAPPPSMAPEGSSAPDKGGRQGGSGGVAPRGGDPIYNGI